MNSGEAIISIYVVKMLLKRRLKEMLFCFCLISVVAGCGVPVETTSTLVTSDERKPPMLTKDEAIQVARRAIRGKARLQKGSPVIVKFDGRCYIVTFIHVHPPGTLGADYHAKVTIDAKSGKVVKLLVGS